MTVKSEPSVPVSVEPLEQLRARYPAAIAEVILVEEVARGKRPPPSSQPQHVFDTEEGLRLICSLERMPATGRVGVHLSASVHDRERVKARIPDPPSLEDVSRLAAETWRAIAQSTRSAGSHGGHGRRGAAFLHRAGTLMPFYRTEDGQGTIHVNFGRRGGPLPCQAPRLETDSAAVGSRCGRIGGKLCDAPAGQDLAGKPLTCDMPLCARHATHIEGKDLDYCPRHVELAHAR